MNQEYNLSPYHNQRDLSSNGPITPLMIDHLRATKPWVRLISVVMFIFVGLTFLGGIFMIFGSAAAGGARGAAGVGPVVGVFYFIFGGLYLIPAYFLHLYASAINDLLRGGGDVAMETALGSQKSFWKFSGILTLIVIGLYALIFFFVIFGALSAFSRF